MIKKMIRFFLNESIFDRIGKYCLKKKLEVEEFYKLNPVYSNSPKNNELFFSNIIECLLGNVVDEQCKDEIFYICFNFCNAQSIDCMRYKNVNEKIENLSCSAYRQYRWAALNSFFMTYGMFETALIVRKKYKQLLYTKHLGIYKMKRLLLYIEDDNIAGIEKSMASLKRRRIAYMANKASVKQVERYLHYVFMEQYPQINVAEDDSLKKYVNGRKVVIEGPAPQKTFYDLENCVYIRNNDFIKREKRKTNIVYINKFSAKYYNENEGAFAKYWDYVCCQDLSVVNHKQMDNVRQAQIPDKLFCFGTPNMLPIMVYDLFGVGSLYITGNNMNISSQIHDDKYKQTVKYDPDYLEFVLALASHDIISQYYFMANLYKHKFFNADDQLKQVLNMGAEEYCREMDKVHGVLRF